MISILDCQLKSYSSPPDTMSSQSDENQFSQSSVPARFQSAGWTGISIDEVQALFHRFLQHQIEVRTFFYQYILGVQLRHTVNLL